MKNIQDKREIRQVVKELRSKDLQIGFVPTMGAIHEGHLSLLKKAKMENDIVICSIFVNPKQFNSTQDFDKYPRTIEQDQALIEDFCDILFHPNSTDFYQDEAVKQYDLGSLETIMEGKFRPGHYQGVARVVDLLFEYVQPHRSYFGEKDYQQIAVIKKMKALTGHPTQIITCPTYRSNEGLALSSRNALLKNSNHALAIYQAEQFIKLDSQKNNDINALISSAIKNHLQNLEVEYFGVYHEDTLEEIHDLNTSDRKKARVFIAAYLDNVRLIDNMSLS